MPEVDELYAQLKSTATFYSNMNSTVKKYLDIASAFPPLPVAATVNSAVWDILKREISESEKVDVKYADVKQSVSLLVSATSDFTVYLVDAQEELIKYWYSWVEVGYYLNSRRARVTV